MKIYYVSHPYEGKQKNEAKADVMVQALQADGFPCDTWKTGEDVFI